MIKKENLFSHSVCICLSILLIYLLGFEQKLDRIFLTYFSLIFLGRFTFFRIFFAIWFVIAALYLPVGFYYGPPNVAVVSAITETDIDEMTEFCSQLPSYFYFVPLILILFFIILFKKFSFPKINNRYLIIFVLGLCCYKPIKTIIRHHPNTFSSITYSFLKNIKYPILEFSLAFYESTNIYLTEKQQQLKQIEQTNSIPIVSVNPKHKTYIIIIGESVRKDYMSAYGFKYDNTPFARNHASVIWDGLITPAPNTQSSIPHLISQSIFSEDKKVNAQLNNNIVSIANDAGFETYWLSNQGKLGAIEITVPRIAAYAKHSFYTKKGEYNGKSSRGKHDTLLLPELDNILSTEDSKPKLIVMHLIGSHSNFCKRLEFKVQFDLNNKNISCYVSSIKETDDLIAQTINILKKHNQDYSVVYFADHGLAHADQYNDLRHNPNYQDSYRVPFIFFDSDKSSQQKINKQISGFQLVYLLSNWIGVKLDVKHDYMQNELSEIPEQQNIKVKDWDNNKLYQFNKLKNDPNPFN
ncbi:phosphoethanolamine transferase [Gilliamella sp. Pas-s25]|uniref:phosphoethanolamine transferase n=1 Tax=Gilliamella sp. Pas-s25 TaxID=2687310 RepID=UPI00135DE4C7|nr:phosphoethanolamine transferase [Gilliamella sp. Pas-s25]MWP63204.1 sulfatase-like hydrolase/transferase [Gilliamella sp. Pas-s25]